MISLTKFTRRKIASFLLNKASLTTDRKNGAYYKNKKTRRATNHLLTKVTALEAKLWLISSKNLCWVSLINFNLKS
jgi:hypothetical protein